MKMLSSRIRFLYRVTKPRVYSENDKRLIKNRQQMHEARVRVHKQTVAYLNKIQDQFLQNHKKKMAEKHFDNQCAFRSKIAKTSFLLFETLEKQKERHQERLQSIEKYIRQQQLKKLNRDRIRKILQYESSNYWIQGDKTQQNWISQRVLPQYIGSTQYYHKLHSQAMAYEDLQLDLLHKLSSNEQSVKYKNRFLIPLFKEVLILMKRVKFSDEQRINKQFTEAQIKIVNTLENDKNKLSEQLEKLRNQKQFQLEQIKERQVTLEGRKQYLAQKIKNLIHLLKTWKQYTDILGMTSNQALAAIGEQKNEQTIKAKKKIIQKDIAKRRDTTFVNPVQQDTEDDQISLTNYLSKNQDQKKDLNPQKNNTASGINIQLENLLKQQQSFFSEISQQIKQKEMRLAKESIQDVKLSKQEIQDMAIQGDIKIDEGYLEKDETTISIEVLKDEFAGDEKMKKLLNTAGQLSVDYPKLFKKIWDAQIL